MSTIDTFCGSARGYSKALAAKLAKVASEIGEVPKSGHNKDQGYHYATETDIVLAVRQRLFAAGIMLYPRVTNVVRESAGSSQSGNAKQRVTLHVTFAFVDGETGDAIELPWAAEAQDTQDKGIAKALTGALKYFLRDTFLLATGDFEDEVDADGQKTGRRVTRQERKVERQQAQLQKSPPRPPDPATNAHREAMAKLHRDMQEQGCSVPGSAGPVWNKYTGWLRQLAEQVLGEEVRQLMDLKPAQVDKVRVGVVEMLKSGSVQPWKG